MLAEQNKQLAQLAADSDRSSPRSPASAQHVAGFIRNATTAGSAAAERRDDIVAGFNGSRRRCASCAATMAQLRRFAEQATPVAADLRNAARGLTGATRRCALLEGGDGRVANLGDDAAPAGRPRRLRRR